MVHPPTRTSCIPHASSYPSYTCTKRQLLSLIGKLAFTCKVIPAGRILLCCLLDTAHSVDDLEHNIHIDSEAIQDIVWWQKFSSSWNGKGIFLESKWTPAHSLHLYMDASSMIGYGAYWNGAYGSVIPGPTTCVINLLSGKNCLP